MKAIPDLMKKFLFILLVLTSFLLSACGGESETNTESFPTWYYNPFGFASLTVSERSENEASVKVATEIEFLDALLNQENQVIEITADLNLGSKEVEAKLKVIGKNLNDYRNVYRAHSNKPLLHPVLIETGVGRIRIRKRENLMIYSKTGNSIKHASFEIDGSKDIVFRNLKFSELWEWDDAGQGKYKRNDWDYFVIEKSAGIWFDHLTFKQAYDGIIDVKDGCSNLTLSFSKLDFNPNEFIKTQINALEENQDLHPYYQSLRAKGITKEELIRLASYQKKGFNLGNTTDGSGFESITFTFHHLEVYNLQDRFPRIRKGDAHLYQVILDNSGITDLGLKINPKGETLVNQGIVTTEDGAVFMENSLFINVSTPIKTHQESNVDSKYTGKFRILNSAYRKGEREYFGSSEGKFLVWEPTNNHPLIPFAFRNYEKLPYYYNTLLDIAFLPEFFEKHPTGALTLKEFNWLKIDNKLHLRGE